MRITSARFRGFKRFRVANIKDIFLQFHAPTLIIIGHNSHGKSSLLRELCPMPATRTDFEPHIGLKDLHIEHKGHQFQIVSDFSNKTSPHHFIMDNTELNVSGSTEVQTELVEKYFGITAPIRDLIYSKLKICQLQKAQRKNLFLTINPLELGLILETHKKAQSKMKDCKAQLQLLHTRKTDIEGKLLKPDILKQNTETKQRLAEELVNIDKVIFSLEQHIATIQGKFREDLEYNQYCKNNSKDLVPVQQIINSCKSILSNSTKFSTVNRGPEYTESREKLRSLGDTLRNQKEDLQKSIRTLSDEINEYQKHLDTALNRPVSTIEKEIQELDKILEKYKDVEIENPIPIHQCDQAFNSLDEIKDLLFIFRDAEVKMKDPEELRKMIQDEQAIRTQVQAMKHEQQRLEGIIKEQTAELDKLKGIASIPEGCQFSQCGLRHSFGNRTKSLQESLQHYTKTLEEHNKRFSDMEGKGVKLWEELKPFIDGKLLEVYVSLQRKLLANFSSISGYQDNKVLLQKLQDQPLMLYGELQSHIISSKLIYEKQQYENKKALLLKELEVLSKSAGTSKEFLEKQLQAKELQVKQSLATLQDVEKEVAIVEQEYAIYLEYASVSNQLKEWNTIFSKGERALLVAKAIEYWRTLCDVLTSTKKQISEDLRHIETIVREQEILYATYNSEILTNIEVITKDKQIFEKIEAALSPTTGIPHRSMVKYLNVMINNVNHFINQVWTSKMQLRPVSETEPLDYNFRMNIANDVVNDIGCLSSGQTEMTNFAWVLTILLQLKMLNQTPIFADELGSTFDPVHRMRLLQFLNNLISNRMIEQMFFVNHYAAMISGFQNADIISLSTDNVLELPGNVNEHVQIIQY